MHYEKKALERHILKIGLEDDVINLIRTSSHLPTFFNDVTGNSYAVVKLRNVEAVTISGNYLILDFGYTHPTGICLE